MTNREESNAAEHETYPGPGPLKADEAKRAIRPVEQMVDAAIERIAREAAARAAKASSSAAASPSLPSAEPGHAITLARSDAAALMATASASSLDSGNAALARADKRSKGRLRWKGLEVSDEFRSYAERVARGEDLPPFAGKILAEPDQAFPWDPKTQKRAARRALKQQIGLWTGVALFLGLSVAVLVVQVRKQADNWQAQESPLAAVPVSAVPSSGPLSSGPLSSVTLANQPSTDAVPGAPENAPVAFHEPSLEATASPEGAAAAAEAAVALNAAPSAATKPAALAPATSAPAPRPAVAPQKAAAAGPGVLVATRAPTVEANGPALPNASPVGAGEPAAKAMGTGGTPAGAGAASGADPTGTGDSASALRADPKKEPTREASGMGSLLVESPSF